MEGMHTVWTRYGKGINPPLKSFAIKYGGMPYRGEGAGFFRHQLLRSAAPANLAGAVGLFHVEPYIAETDPAKTDPQSPRPAIVPRGTLASICGKFSTSDLLFCLSIPFRPSLSEAIPPQ